MEASQEQQAAGRLAVFQAEASCEYPDCLLPSIVQLQHLTSWLEEEGMDVVRAPVAVPSTVHDSHALAQVQYSGCSPHDTQTVGSVAEMETSQPTTSSCAH